MQAVRGRHCRPRSWTSGGGGRGRALGRRSAGAVATPFPVSGPQAQEVIGRAVLGLILGLGGGCVALVVILAVIGLFWRRMGGGVGAEQAANGNGAGADQGRGVIESLFVQPQDEGSRNNLHYLGVASHHHASML